MIYSHFGAQIRFLMYLTDCIPVVKTERAEGGHLVFLPCDPKLILIFDKSNTLSWETWLWEKRFMRHYKMCVQRGLTKYTSMPLFGGRETSRSPRSQRYGKEVKARLECGGACSVQSSWNTRNSLEKHQSPDMITDAVGSTKQWKSLIFIDIAGTLVSFHS